MTAPFDDPIPGGTLPDGEAVYSPKMFSQAAMRKFMSLGGSGYFALGISGPGGPVDADLNSLSLKVWFKLPGDTTTDERGELIAEVDEADITRDDLGKYHYNIGHQHTMRRGMLVAEWTYKVAGAEITFFDRAQILDQMPMWESLREDTKLTVEQIGWHFADLFDSTAGGPWLQENFQTHFNYERIAFLLGQAVMKFNVLAYPVTNYGVTRDDKSIPENFQALMVWAGKLEVIRHLMLSYTEQPEFRNMSTTYTDRRDYAQRWKAMLDEEKPEFEKAVKLSKRSLLSLGRGAYLVAGGIYGGSARSFFQSGMYAAQTRSMRFYPAAPSVTFGNMASGSPF
ncbi:hypothetical protein SEA_PUPPER_108 [Gordonia phage Pupper]|uniref:Uncharacterized protein n=1 Tax=Gordonia phage Pupper TaxID=2571249 RepID=A0A4Y6ETG3_9CAUD|nr:hypothetical protein KHQ83_gp169 [Gordonia phage Pupper]QDF18594.1 hypothetical protein SEA_PUPPER_108 [Gordonia phage Pupper]QDF18826.1 hypothetical protein SEA_SCENTAE_107 [Gordonia phage SCentae]